MALGSVSLNMVWNPAIKGSNFLQASIKGIHTYATKLHKVNILGATNFSLLSRNIKSLDNHLGSIRSKVSKISANPIKLDVKTSRASLKEARKDMTAIEHDAKQVAFWTKKSAENLSAGANIQGIQSKKSKQKLSATSTLVSAGLISGVMALPFKASIDFESSMADVKALTKDITAKDFDALTAKAKELGASTEWSATQAAQGMTYLAKAGFDTKQQLGAMSGVLGLATAGNLDLASTADISSNILSGFSIKASQMGMVSDVLAKTFTTSNTDLTMLGETMSYVAPIASGLGASITEVSSLAGKLGDVGIQGSMAGTSLRQMYTRLSAPPTEAKKALDSLGVSAFDIHGKFKGMPNIIGELNKSMAGMGEDVKAEKLKDIFGMTALSSGMALLKIGKKNLLDYKKTLDTSTGTTAKIQKVKLDTTGGDFKLLNSALESLSITATTSLLPTIRLVTKGITSVVSGVEVFSTKFPTASKWVFGLGAAFVVGAIALAGFGFVASGVATAVGLISLPITAVTAGIVALAGAGVYLYNKFEGVRQFFNSFGSSFLSSISPAIEGLKSSFSSIIGSLSSIYQSVKPVFLAIGSLFARLVGVKTAGAGFGYVIGKAFTLTLVPIRAVAWAISKVLSFVAGAFLFIANLPSKIASGWNALKSKVSSIWGGIVKAIAKPFVTFFAWIENKFKKIFGIISKVKNIASNITAGVKNTVSNVKNKASKVWAGTKDVSAKLWSGTKNLFGFGDDKKEKKETKKATVKKTNILTTQTVKAVNNVNYKSSIHTSTNKKNIETKNSLILKKENVKNLENKKINFIDKKKLFKQPFVNTQERINKTNLETFSLKDTPVHKLDNTLNTTDEAIAQTKEKSIQRLAGKHITQNITQNITVTAGVDGKVDYEDLKEKILRIQKELQHEDVDIDFMDAS